MEAAVVGNCVKNIVRGDENVKVLGFCKVNNNIGKIAKSKVCFGGFRLSIKPLHSADFVGYSSVHKVSSDGSTTSLKSADGSRLYVGLPEDVVSECGKVNHEKAVTTGLKALKLMGVHGVELPVWWGIVEKDGIGKYDWSGYLAVTELVRNMGLKLHVSLCFHASRQQKILLPDWVLQIGETEPSIYFTDRSGSLCKDCLSLAIDEVPILNGKSPVEIYREFSESFKSVFSSFMGSTITGITVGLGPDGELRYPSCHYTATSTDQTGVGEFQCYDKYMLKNLKEYAELEGHPLWGLGGPHDVPAHNEPPSVNTFFKNDGGSWESPYGDFFLSWYSSQLLAHGTRMLSLASSMFSDIPVTISGKLPLVHSWYQARSHPSELTAGFYNTDKRDGYDAVVEMFAKHTCNVILPGMELSAENRANGSSPRSLLAQIKGSCGQHGVVVNGQNSLVSGPREFDEIRRNLSNDDDVAVDLFMYQRMGAAFFSPKHFPLFSAFVRAQNQLDLDVDDLPDNVSVECVRATSEGRVNRQVQTA